MSTKVVITGCSTGIGLATAVLLAKDKENQFKVFATMRNLAKKEKLEESAWATLDKTLFIRQLDVTKEESIVECIDRIKREEGGVDILINNAGIGQAGVLEKVQLSQIRTIYETNVFGLIKLTQAVIPGMKAKRYGRIINVGSLAGIQGFPFSDIYVSSKFAVEGFSEALAPVLKKFNISVSVIEPGPVKTNYAANMKANETSDAELTEVDDLTRQLYKTVTTRAEQLTVSSGMLQTGDEIAVIIRDVILSDNPHLHYPTSDAMKNMAAMKYVDPTGDSTFNLLVSDLQLKEC